ncbi:MAG: hypothetical protein WC755_01955 [Candidatus Woesearchaeota archaeon]|jgi:hypothetical protein
MYIPDGSKLDYDVERDLTSEELKNPDKIPHDYSRCGEIPNRYSWGWLGDSVESKYCGWDDQKLKKKVLDLLNSDLKQYVVMNHCGWHDCEICEKENKDNKGDDYAGNGSYLIIYKNKEYRCPELVKHYISKHDYNPGPEVIEALFNGKWKTRKEEKEKLDKDFEERINREKEEEIEKERLRLSKMTKKEIEREKQQKIEYQNFLEYSKQKVKQLRESGAIVE